MQAGRQWQAGSFPGQLLPASHSHGLLTAPSFPPCVCLSCPQEVEKLQWATIWGADTIMDLRSGQRVREPSSRGCWPPQLQLVGQQT